MSCQDVYTHRLRLGERWQPDFYPSLTAIHEHCFPAALPDCPFGSLPIPTIASRFSGDFLTTQGPPANAPSDVYLYRYVALRSFLACILWNGGSWTATLPTAPSVLFEDNALDQILDFWQQEQRRLGRDWLLLSNYATGFYGTKRQFSFWSDTLVGTTPPEVIKQGYRSGIPSDSFQPISILLRCKHENATLKVPTILDGLDFSLFCPVDLSTNPPHGLAINIEDAPTLTRGNREYVLPLIDVANIEFMPVYLDSRDHPQTCKEENLFTPFADYLAGLL